MKIMITGVNGFTGQHLFRILAGKGFEVHGISRGPVRFALPERGFYHPVELTNVRTVIDCFDLVKPDVVIHTAAMSKPDECHQNPQACLLQNVEATRHLLEASRPHPVHFIYFSTDFIFGEHGPHSEDDLPAPLNFYGESKWKAEQLVEASGITATIVRPVFIYGNQYPGMRPSFIQWVKQQLQAGKPIQVVTDQLRTPTYVNDLAMGLQQIITYQRQGVYHLAGKDIVSPCEMAFAVADVWGLDATLIEPVTADVFPEPVRRAKQSGLQIQKAVRELSYQPLSFREALQEIHAAEA